MIFSNQKLIFLHVPRCAGTAINQFLWNKENSGLPFPQDPASCHLDLMWGTYEKYSTDAFTKIELDHALWRHYEYFHGLYFMENSSNIFSVVRDPLSRLISVYQRALTIKENRFFSKNSNGFIEYCVTSFLQKARQSIEEFHEDSTDLKVKHNHMDFSHFIPQVEILGDRKGEVNGVTIIPIERLDTFASNQISKPFGLFGFKRSLSSAIKNSFPCPISEDEFLLFEDFSLHYYSKDSLLHKSALESFPL